MRNRLEISSQAFPLLQAMEPKVQLALRAPIRIIIPRQHLLLANSEASVQKIWQSLATVSQDSSAKLMIHMFLRTLISLPLHQQLLQLRRMEVSKIMKKRRKRRRRERALTVMTTAVAMILRQMILQATVKMRRRKRKRRSKRKKRKTKINQLEGLEKHQKPQGLSTQLLKISLSNKINKLISWTWCQAALLNLRFSNKLRFKLLLVLTASYLEALAHQHSLLKVITYSQTWMWINPKLNSNSNQAVLVSWKLSKTIISLELLLNSNCNKTWSANLRSKQIHWTNLVKLSNNSYRLMVICLET